jgi:limonene-1,2-epoxide hydrolase
MTREAEDRVLAFLKEFESGDKLPNFDAVMAHFAEGATYQSMARMITPMVGKEQIREELERQWTIYTDGTYETHIIASTGKYVFTERTDSVTFRHNGKRLHAKMLCIFEIGADGRFIRWREYNGTRETDVQLEKMNTNMTEVIAAMAPKTAD